MEQTQTGRAELELALKRVAAAGMETLVENVALPADVRSKVLAATVAVQTEIRLAEAATDGWQ